MERWWLPHGSRFLHLSALLLAFAVPPPASAAVAEPAPAPAYPVLRKVQFLRGDATADATVDLTDAVFVLNYLFGGGIEPGCAAAADVNADRAIDLTDAVGILIFLFLDAEGAVPPAPGPYECGVDPTDDGAGCLIFSSCPDDTPLIAHVLGRVTFGATEDLYRRIQTRKDLIAYLEEQLAAPDGYDARVHEPAVHARVEGLGIRYDQQTNIGEQESRLKASVLVHALQSRWQLLQVVSQFWNNHFHTQQEALRENFFGRGGRGGGALQASAQIFDMADTNDDQLLGQVEWEAFQALHPGLITWEEFGRRFTTDGIVTPDEFQARNQIAAWKYANGGNQMGIAAEMERRENDFFRNRAFGPFRDLVEGSAKGVPMLIYLNGFENTLRAPNENYAREVLELFVAGVDHVYTQRDIEQLAKVFTGWSVGWVARAPYDPAADPQYILHPESATFPINLREPRPVAAPTRQFWEDELYTWAFVVNRPDHDWGRKDLFLPQYGGVDSLGAPVEASERVQIPANTADRTVAAALGEFDVFLDRLVAFRDSRKFISTKLIQLFVTDDLGALDKTREAPAEVAARFRAADADSSGAIAPAEWALPVPPSLPNGRPPELFDRLDADGDGTITLREYQEPDLLLAAMERWDATDGNIREVVRAILFSDEFLSLKFQGAKVKTPLEQVTSTLRILNAAPTDAQLKVSAADMAAAGMDMFQFGDPTGESELGFDWMHTIGLLERLKWISRGGNPERVADRRFDWSPAPFAQTYGLGGRDEIADFFIQLIHPQGILSADRSLAIQAFDDALSRKLEAMVTFLLSIAPAMQQ